MQVRTAGVSELGIFSDMVFSRQWAELADNIGQ